ncbi:DHA2 family efflux MFS transporter permease subunit [Syntrophomonas palmitatica]|uniref:DHA2 family efflux MFS transporter permease subunit n=1 Tax=Syntrophomonas palmitatica TaxID=402877 RepID=UPI0006D0B7F2|nr:DHA2 family efflux MFS transporter permease subunit [Syntrophomonas palmitatica]
MYNTTDAAKAGEKLNFAILPVIIIGTFMSVMDGTIVNVSLPKMISVFNSSTTDAQWIVTAYMLTLGIVMPISGYLGDRFGYKRVYSAALLVFVIGSFLCGAAWSINSIIAFRVLQAMGGGIMQPLGMAILYQNYPRERMGMVLGLWGISMMLAPAIGPTLGGYLVDYLSWRFIFYVNVPVGILNLFMAKSRLKETPLIKGHSFDFVGIATSAIGFFSLLLAFSQGNRHGWTSPYIVFLFFVSVFFLTIFIYNELHHSEPVMDLRLFKNYVFSISIVVSSIISIGMFAVVFLMPLLLQSILGKSAVLTGLILLPAALASGIVMPLAGRIFDNYGARALVMGGLLCLVITTYMLHGFNDMTPVWVMIFWLVMRGFGMGFCFMPSTTAGMNTVPPHLVGRASALNNVIRQIASAFGIAMFTSILANRQTIYLADLIPAINVNSNEYLHIQTEIMSMASGLGIRGDSVFAMTGSMIMQQAVKESMVKAMGDCFIIAAGLTIIALILASFFKGRQK